MKRALCLLALAWPAARSTAQDIAASSVPVVPAKATVLGVVRDTSSRSTRLLPHEAAASPVAPLIAYSTDFDLRVFDAKSGASSVVFPGEVYSPSWSAAGNAIAFVKEDDRGRPLVWSMRVDPTTGRAVGDAQRVSLSEVDYVAPRFSPDGRLLAFVRSDPGWGHASLAVVPATGGAERVLVTGLSMGALRWANDGSAIYYITGRDSSSTNAKIVCRVALAGGAPQVIREFTNERLGVMPGAHAFRLEQPTTTDGVSSLVTDLSGKPLARLTYPADESIKDWATDRPLVVRESHPRGLRLMTISDGKSRTLIDSSSEVAGAAWFADGRRVAAMTMRGGRFYIEILNLDGGVAKRVPLERRPLYRGRLDHPSDNSFLTVSPDGKFATYNSSTPTTLVLVNLETGVQRVLVQAQAIATPFWRADSKALRYIRTDGFPIGSDNRGVHEVSLDGNDRLVLPLPQSQYPRVVWGLDASTLASFGDFGHRIVPVDDGSPIVTLRTPVQGAGYISSDRRFIALRVGKVNERNPSRKLVLASLVDSTHREVALPFLDVGVMAYDAGPHNIFIRGRETETGPLNVYAVPLDGSKARMVTPINTKEDLGIFEGSPDHRAILYSVAATRTATFISLDFSAGLARLVSSGKR